MNRIAIEHKGEDVSYGDNELHWDPNWTIDDLKEYIKVEGKDYILPVIVLTDAELMRFSSRGPGFRLYSDIRDWFFLRKDSDGNVIDSD